MQNIDVLIGRAVISLDTANRLGTVHDLIIDPNSGELAGFSIEKPDKTYALLRFDEIHGLGPDALMVDADHAPTPTDNSPLAKLPLAKQLVGVKVINEHGEQMGHISRIFVHFGEPASLIYEVRASIFDRLLGHALYFPAALAESLSDDRTVLVVADDPEEIERSLEAMARRVNGTDQGQLLPGQVPVHVTVRSRGE